MRIPASIKAALGTVALLVAIAVATAGCVRPGPGSPNLPSLDEDPTVVDVDSETTGDTAVATRQPPIPLPTYEGIPTPDTPYYDPPAEDLTHTVAAGESLGYLATLYGSTIEELATRNGIANPDLLEVGQVLVIPGEEIPLPAGPDLKLIPDSELVYGPQANGFDLHAYAAAMGGYLTTHQEVVEGINMSGPDIVELVADRTSVNPRLLLAVLEHRSRWLTNQEPEQITNPLGHSGPAGESLYGQLAWAANQLNLGFYGRAEGGLRTVDVGADTRVLLHPAINHGTAGVQNLLAAFDGVNYEAWLEDTGPDGFLATYEDLFGSPFAYTFEPLLPPDLAAPEMALPWPAGETWYYTSGPHGAWNSGSAWGALDFAPPADQLGCVQSDSWVTAMTPGVVTRSDNGAVVIDLDGDGYAGTGWAITYMHLESRDRVAAGTQVETGDRLGHPSCEGGVSNGTHVHVTRSYNGRWISADGSLPFVMSGWESQGAGIEYEGYLVRGETVREACACRDEANAISHD